MAKEESCCCSATGYCAGEAITPYDKKDEWVTGEIRTAQGSVPVVSADLHFKDTLGA